MPIIEVDHLTKEYQLGQLVSLRQAVQNGWARLTGGESVKRQPFLALDDVSFSVEPGEVLGIIGHNGAGKSTLLKMLAGISKPTGGKVTVRGSVAPLIEVGAGLVPDLTGRENIYLNGTILGMRRDEIKRKFDEIVSFAELESFIDTPIKRYSSGMKVKLAFSIASSVHADILIIDEVLAVGDLAFQRKCFTRLEDLIKRRGNTVLLVSHNIRQIERICGRVILLNKGKVFKDDTPSVACQIYYQRSDDQIARNSSAATLTARHWRSSGDIELEAVNIIDKNGQKISVVGYNEDIRISLQYQVNSKLIKPVFSVGIHTTDFLYLATHDSQEGMPVASLVPGKYEVHFKIKRFPFLPGVYSIRARVGTDELDSAAFSAESLLNFRVEADVACNVGTMGDGFIALEAEWGLLAATTERGSLSTVFAAE